MSIPIIVVVAVLVLAAVVGMAIVWWQRKKRMPQCACFELIGDNPNCPIADHRIQCMSNNGSVANRGRI